MTVGEKGPKGWRPTCRKTPLIDCLTPLRFMRPIFCEKDTKLRTGRVRNVRDRRGGGNRPEQTLEAHQAQESKGPVSS
jgi:hypothetical protein